MTERTEWVYVVLRLVKKGYSVRSSVMVCRNAETAVDAQSQMQREDPDAEVSITKVKLND